MKTDIIKKDTTIPATIKIGSVLEVKKAYAILLSEGMECVYVNKKEGMAVGQTIYYFEEDIYKSNKMNYKNFLVYVASICFMFIILYSATHVIRIGQQPPVSYGIVTMDINPSVEMRIDMAGKVLEIMPLNEDATVIIQDEYRGMLLEDVLDILTNNAVGAGFLKEDGVVMLTYTVVNQEKQDLSEVKSDEDENSKRIEAYMEKKRDHYKFLFAKGTEEGLRAAKSQGLTVGKYMFMKYMSEDISLEKMKEMSIEEIFGIIENTDFEYNDKHAPVLQSPSEDKSQDQRSKTNNSNKDKDKEIPRSSDSSEEEINNSDKDQQIEKEVEKEIKEVEKEAEKEIKEVEKEEVKVEKEEVKVEKEEVKVEKEEIRDEEKEIKEVEKDEEKEIKEVEKEAEKEIKEEIKEEEKEADKEEKEVKEVKEEEADKEVKEEKTNNGIGKQDDTNIEEIKDTESGLEKEKVKDTTKVNSSKSETKTETKTEKNTDHDKNK
ncbi:MAG: anti-sigma factor domain-containing protein [Vallitaleaceae bacterium]|nr:anti-sigma factor domain-containing protein [Vallitaleaceae bacterium]